MISNSKSAAKFNARNKPRFYRIYRKYRTPFCYANTKVGLEFRHARILGMKKFIFKHTGRKFTLAN